MNQNQNQNPNRNEKDELPKVAQGTRPFTKYKIIELAVCLLAVILGLLYLYTDTLSLDILLPIYAVCFCAIVPLRYLDQKANGLHGGWAMLSVILWALLALVVVVSTAVYFIWY